MEINLPWKEMYRHVGPIGTGLILVLHSKLKGNWFFFDSLAVPLMDSGDNGIEFALTREPEFARQGIDSAWNILKADPVCPPGYIRIEGNKRSLDEIVDASHKANSNGNSRAIFIDDIGKVTRADGSPGELDFVSKVLHHMALDLDVPVIVGMGENSDMSGYRHFEVEAHTIFKVSDRRDFDCMSGYHVCKESAESPMHKNLLVEVVKNQSGALGRFKV